MKPLAEHGTNQHAGGRANSTSSTHGSTDANYLVRRLKRDRPKIAAALARGEFPSARAAGIAAGFVKVPSALAQIRKLWLRLTPEERIVFADEIAGFRKKPTAVL